MSTPATTKTLPARPLSPFMIGPYYKPQMTSMLSILHRITGVGLTFGTLLIAGWLFALASGEDAYAAVAPHAAAWYGTAVLVAFSWALLYHFCNGIRHLVWDAGKGLDMVSATRSGYASIIGSVVLTAAVWAVVFLA